MFKPLTSKELERFSAHVQKAAQFVGGVNAQVYRGYPEEEQGVGIFFEKMEGEPCAFVLESKVARKMPSWQIMTLMKQRLDEMRDRFENDPALSGVNPSDVDFSEMKGWQLRWKDRPFVSDGFRATADRIPRETWEIMLNNLKVGMRRRLLDYLSSLPQIDYQELAQTLSLYQPSYVGDIQFTALAQVDHFRVMGGNELILYLSMTFATREEIEREVSQFRAAGAAPTMLSDTH